MISTNSSLLERPASATQPILAHGISNGIELALFNARGAMLDGWDFTPEGVRAYAKPTAWQDDPVASREEFSAEEDEVEDMALYFSE